MYTLKIMVLIQSLVQIILESLPISSSGHLLLVQRVTDLPMLSKSFEYLLHGPTIILLMIYFRSTWVALLMQCWRYRNLIVRMIFLGALADTITAVVYGCMQLLAPWFPLWVGFGITAGMLFSLRSVSYKKAEMSYAKAAAIGLVQGISGLPGISRLASTYVAGVWLGLSPRKSFYFSCMIQFPLILAGFLCGVWTVPAGTVQAMVAQPYTVLALVGATTIAYYLLQWVQKCMQAETLWKFGFYLLAPFLIALVF